MVRAALRSVRRATKREQDCGVLEGTLQMQAPINITSLTRDLAPSPKYEDLSKQEMPEHIESQEEVVVGEPVVLPHPGWRSSGSIEPVQIREDRERSRSRERAAALRKHVSSGAVSSGTIVRNIVDGAASSQHIEEEAVSQPIVDESEDRDAVQGTASRSSVGSCEQHASCIRPDGHSGRCVDPQGETLDVESSVYQRSQIEPITTFDSEDEMGSEKEDEREGQRPQKARRVSGSPEDEMERRWSEHGTKMERT